MKKHIVALIIAATSAISTSAQNDSIILDKIMAVIGRQAVMYSDIENQFAQMKQQGYYVTNDARCEILEQAMYTKLLVHKAWVDTVEVSDAEVNNELEYRINYYANQIGSIEKLEEYYGKSISEIREEYSETIREQKTAERMQQTIGADVSVTPQDVRNYYKSIPSDSLPIINTEFELEQLAIFPKVQESEVLRIKDRLREFKNRVANGESFATLAVLYSEDRGSAMRGGELGFMSRGDLVAEFSAVAFSLEPNEVSKVVKTEYGYHIIQMIEKKGERMNCRHILMKPQISYTERQNTMNLLDSIKNLIDTKEVTFKEACWKFSDDEDTRLNGGVMVNNATGTSRFEAEQLDPKVATAIRNLEVGQVSKPFETEDEQGRTVCKIVLLRNKTAPHKASLGIDYQRLQDMALAKKREDYMKEWIEQTINETYIRIDPEYKNCNFSIKAWKYVE
ncbi:MAG: peptidylprolyl isomerase [Salinivirgaceae bacterium]|nr:peptidylprolyl isomerase [Salinivirgaceae bacterium]